MGLAPDGRDQGPLQHVEPLLEGWLNDRSAPHSEALRLVERVRPIQEGRYLEYQVTADDPQVLAELYTYTRYYEKLDREIMQDVCEY